jgi:hypothetical protein
MPTLDCFRDQTGTITAIVSGAASAPIVFAGERAGVTLQPARTSGLAGIVMTCKAGTPGLYTGDIESDPHEPEVRLRAVIDGQPYSGVARWPVSPPAPDPKPRARRRAA